MVGTPPAPPALGVGLDHITAFDCFGAPSAERSLRHAAACVPMFSTPPLRLTVSPSLCPEISRIERPSRESGAVYLLTSDRYLCEAAEIQGTGSRWRQIDDTRLEVRASIINRDYN